MQSFSRRATLRLVAAAGALPLVLAGARHAQAATHQVQIKGFAFSPAQLDVAVGDTVVFTNGDGAPHTASASSGAFDTGRLNRGQSAQVQIGSAGSHNYVCKFHPNMKGVIRAS